MFFEFIMLAIVFTAFIAIVRNLSKKLSKNEPTETIEAIKPNVEQQSPQQPMEQIPLVNVDSAIESKETKTVNDYLKLASENSFLAAKLAESESLDQSAKMLQETRRAYEKALQFMKIAKGFSPVGILGDQTIFRYLYAKGYLYEFFDTVSENNKGKQMTEESLMWARLFYKRVVNPLPFYESHIRTLLG